MALQTFGTKKEHNTEFAYRRGKILKTHKAQVSAIIAQRESKVRPIVKTNRAIQSALGKLIQSGKPLNRTQEEKIIKHVSTLITRIELTLKKPEFEVLLTKNGLVAETNRMLHEVVNLNGIQQSLRWLKDEGMTQRNLYEECLTRSKIQKRSNESK